MATLDVRRFHGKPLLQPNYNFRDVPWCAKDLTGSTLSIVTERQHLVDSIAELTLVCSEATRRKKPDPSSSSAMITKKTTKPLSIEYIFDRIDTDDPIWGLMVRTDTPMSFKGRTSNLKSSPKWKRGMLQGFITMTTFTNWQSSFRFDSLHEMAFGQDDDELEEQMKNGERKYDEDGSLAEELEACVKGGNPHIEGIVYPRIAEVSLFGGLACGKQLLRLLIEHLECLKATARQNYDYIVLQATENSIPFYESMGFTRVGCVQGKAPSPDKYHTNPVNDYHTKKNGETPASIAKDFGVDAWDIVFLNKTVYPELVQKSWLKVGTKIFVPTVHSACKSVITPGNVVIKSASVAPKWYKAQENETPRGIAKKFQLNFSKLLQANKKRYPDLVGQSKLMEGTLIQTNRFDIDEGDTIAYSHWTFPDADQEDNDMSYMMALKLNRKKGLEAKVKPVADSLAVLIQNFSPEATGVKDLMLQPKVPQAPAPLAPIFTKKSSLKEPKKPKRPMTSYAHFTADARSSMAEEFRGMSLGEVNKIVSEKWKAVSDEEKALYQERFEQSRAAYNQAMKKYEADMERFQSESPHDTTDLTKHYTSLLEKVVKLKSNDGASKFEYYYVLTFIPDLQWVHLIPMRKAGVFGPENSDACGRPIWMIVGEEEGKEIDTTAAECQPVTALTVKNSADADDEQWNIYDNGEIPPAPRPVPISTSKATNAPTRPKKPANSFALFCGDAKSVMKEQLENKPMVERTKIIAERWKVMTDEEKKKYRDQHAKAHEKYAKVLRQYKDDLAKFQRENPGIDASSSSAISCKTPKSAKKIKAPPSSCKTNAENGESQKKNRGWSRKNPEAGMEETPTLKRKRGRPRKNPLPDDDSALNSSTKAVVYTMKSNPIVLEALLGKLKGDSSEQSESNDAPDKPGKNDVILSLIDDSYKKIMWRNYNILGTTRDKKRENEVCDDVFKILKQKMGNRGKFFKRSSERDFVMDDVAAREKIIADIRRRVPSSQKWQSGEESQQSLEGAILSPPVKSPPVPLTKKSSQLGDNDVVLSLLHEKYKNILWSHYRKLGRVRVKGDTGEEETGKTIFRLLKKELGKGGAFFKKSVRGDELFEVTDDVALQKITRDLKRRMESIHKWLESDSHDVSSIAEERPLLTPTRKVRQGGLPRTWSEPAESKPKLSPSRYPRRGSQLEIYPPEVVDKVQKIKHSSASPIKHHSGDEDAHLPSQPAEGLPEGWVTRRIPRKNLHDSRVDTRWYSPELNLRFRSVHDAKLFALRAEALGKGEDAAMQPTSPKDTSKPQKRPLAPIFLKDYGKKKKQAVSAKRPTAKEEPKEASTKASRYPGRKRKQVIDDSHFVSDDAVSDTCEPRKKKAKTKH